MRARSDESRKKDGGSVVGGDDNGRKPLVRETVKGASFARSLSSVGMVVRRGKVGGVARDPILITKLVGTVLRRVCFFVLDVCRRDVGDGENLGIYALAGRVPASVEG